MELCRHAKENHEEEQYPLLQKEYQQNMKTSHIMTI
jgi:hypothetical protein